MEATRFGRMNTYEAVKKELWRFLRMLKAVVVLATLLASAATILIFVAPLTFFLPRFYSVHWSRKLTSHVFGCWLSMWPFFFEKINGTRVVFSGHRVPQGERAIVMCNHRTEVDWMYVWSLALRKKRIGSVKYVVKSSVRNAPVFGWAFHVLEFLLIDRRWQADELIFESMLSTFKGFQDPLWLVIFPEGTDYTEEKRDQSQKFAEEHGLPKLHHVLMPRTKGVYACLAQLHDSVDAVYDLTVGYSNGRPLFIDNALGTNPREVHIHVRRIPATEIPVAEKEVGEWLVKVFSRKDALLSHFYTEGVFPDGGGGDEELSTATGMANAGIIVLASWALLRLLFSPVLWVKFYVAFSTVLLTSSTYFNYRPVPIFKGRRTGPLGSHHH